MAAGRKLGEAYIAVTADARGVGDDLSREASEALDRAARKMGETLDERLRESVEDSTEGLDDVLGDQLTRGTQRAGGRFQQDFRKALSAAVSNLPDVTLGADASEVDVVLAGVRTQLAALRDANIGVDLDAAAALQELATLDAVLAQVSASSVDVSVRADTDAARAELARLNKAVRDVDGKGISIPGGPAAAASMQAVAAATRVTGNFAGFAGIALKGLLPIIAAIVLALGALIPAAIAAAGVLAAIGTAAAAGIGVAIMGFSGVGDAMKLLTQREDALASAVGGGGAAAGAAASAARALTNARQNAADAAEDSARRVARAQEELLETELDAAEAIARAQRDAAEDVAAAVARYQQAEASLAGELRAVQRAQEALTDARRAAARELEDLDEAVSDNSRAQREAVRDLEEAAAHLDYVLGNSWSSDAQREAAQLNYDTQLDRMDDLERAARRLQEDQAIAAKKGVEGSDRVVSAQERLADAQSGVAAAHRAIGDAAVAIDAARADSALSVAEAHEDAGRRMRDASRAVEDALREQERSARQSAYAVESAMAAVATAAAGAGGSGSEALAKINRELADVDPATMRFAEFMRDRVQPAWEQLKSNAAAGLLPGVEQGLRNLEPMLPRFESLVSTISTKVGDLFSRAGERLNSPFWQDFFADLEEKSGPILDDLAVSIGNVTEGIAGIVQAFLGLSGDDGYGLADATEGFAEWGRTLKDNPEFTEFIEDVKDALPEIIEGAKNFGSAMLDVYEFFEEHGDTIMAFFADVADAIESVTTFLDGEITAEEVWGFLQNLSPLSIGRELGGWLVEGILDGLGWLKDKAVEKWHELVDGFKSFFGINSPSTVFADFGVNIIEGLLGGLGSMVGNVITWFGELPGKIVSALTSLGSLLGNVFGGAWDWVHTTVADKGGQLVEFVRGLPGRFVSAIGNLGSTLLQAGKDLIQGLVNGITSAAGFVGDVGKTVVNAIIGFINTQAIDRINDLLEFKVAGITINPPDIPRIPKLADGAIVNRATLALVGEAGPEAVIPLSAGRSRRRQELMEEAGLSGGGPTLQVDARQYYEVRDTQTAQEVGAVVGQRIVRDLRTGVSSRYTGEAA